MKSSLRTKPKRPRTRARFLKKRMASSASSATTEEVVDDEFIDNLTVPKLERMDLETLAQAPEVPYLFTFPPRVKDYLHTETSEKQDDTVRECLPFLQANDPSFVYNKHGVARLERELHKRFLPEKMGVRGKFPPGFVAADASRPWFLYWNMAGLALLGEDVSSYRDRLVATARSMQNDTGGFGGGFGQTSHLATTYAVILALSLVGGQEAYEVVDRRAMWRWLCSLKQPDGGFQVCLGGEEDIRGAYCAAVVITLLNLPIDLTTDSPAWTGDSSRTLFTDLADYVRRCQTYEGGISGQPDSEAHGAYAFCALGCLSILDAPDRIIPKYLDIPRLVSWLSSRQYAPEGGFSGRTNKLVDGCYSHWVGGCWPLIEACLNGPGGPTSQAGEPKRSKPSPAAGSLFSRGGLIRYILCCCQDLPKRGGLRDKPSKGSDSYHTCYCLSGLSSAQHQWRLVPSEDGEAEVWTVSPYVDEEQVFEEVDRVEPIHPVYAIPKKNVDEIIAYFSAKQGF